MSLKYDPGQVFQRLVKGGFKLFQRGFDGDGEGHGQVEEEGEGHEEL